MNILYAQAGGATAVINASAAGVIEAARGRFDRVLAAHNGILGVIGEHLHDCHDVDVDALANTPGAFFGACRVILPSEDAEPALFERLINVLAAHDIGAFLYNGGNGSLEVVVQLSAAARRRGYPLTCVGVPKTIDNDIVGCDCCPGFGTAAKYLATSMREVSRDLASMHSRKRRLFVMETMGRNVGWLSASTALAATAAVDAPHIILVPEVSVDFDALLARAGTWLDKLGYCAITVAEGVRRANGEPICSHAQPGSDHWRFGGAGGEIARLLSEALDCHRHYAAPDYLQRSAAHWVSAVDHAQALAVGRVAVDYALEGRDGVVAVIRRLSDDPYRWDIIPSAGAEVATLERRLPQDYITDDGMQITEAGLRYLAPLIEGERPVRCVHGLPEHYRKQLIQLPRRLPDYHGWGEDLVVGTVLLDGIGSTR